MDSFQKTTLMVAIGALIVCLVFIGITLRNAKGQTWPPMVPACPDYWTIDLSGNTCVNIHNLGNNKCKPTGDANHLTLDTTTVASNCDKYKWANKCGVSWDGITYGVKNPCDTTT